MIPWLKNQSYGRHRFYRSDDHNYWIDTFILHTNDRKEFTLSLYTGTGTTDHNRFSMYSKINHPTLDILNKTHSLLLPFNYHIAGIELTSDIIDTQEKDNALLHCKWFQQHIWMSNCKMSTPRYKNTTYWGMLPSSPKSLRLYSKDDDPDIGVENSCRLEVIHRRKSLESLSINTIPDLLDIDHACMAKLFEHISLKEIDWIRFKKLFAKTDSDKTFENVKRNVIRKLRDTQLNDTIIYGRKYLLKPPIMEHKYSKLFHHIISEGTFKDWLFSNKCSIS